MQEWKQGTLFPGHEPADVIGTASQWAARRAGHGAQVHFSRGGQGWGEPHELSVSVPVRNGRRIVSSLSWHPKTGEILSVHTSVDFGRRGLATGLLNIARSFGDEQPGISYPRHSGSMSPDGRAWAASVGV